VLNSSVLSSRTLGLAPRLAVLVGLAGIPTTGRAQDAAAPPVVEPSIAVPAAAADPEAPPAPEPASPAPAEPASDEIQVMVVGTPIARTPGSAHVVRGKQLERQKYDDPTAVLTTVPGVYVRSEDGFGLRPNIGIRGVNPDRSKKITLMEDGVLFGPAPYSAPAAYYFPMIGRMTQVRVVKGPGAVAYGPQTISGAIDFITRPIPELTAGGVDLSGGQYGFRKAHGYFGSSDGQVGFLAEGLHVSTDGFKELPGAQDTGFYRNDVMFKTSYVIDPNASVQNELRLKFTYSDELSNETYLGITDDDFDEDPLQRYAASALDRMRNHRTSLVATHVLDPSDDVKLTTDVYRNDYYRIWRKANHFRGAALFDVITNPDDPRNEIFLGILRGEYDSSTPQEALLIGPNEREFVSQGIQSRLSWDAQTGAIAHRMEYGVRFHHDRIDRRHSEDAFLMIEGELYPEGTPTDVVTLNEAWSYAFAANASDAMTWRSLTITPGLRFELIRSGLADHISGDQNERWAQALLPGVGVYYALTEQLGLLAGVYRGFSAPAPGSESDIDPELSWNYEAGARYTRGAARAELIGFFNDYQNMTDLCTFSSGCADQELDQQFDAGRARIFGFEAFVDYDVPLSSSLKLPVGVAYTFTVSEFLNTFRSDDPIFGDVDRGDEIPYVPDHLLSATLGLEHERAGGNLRATYISAMREQPGDEPLSEVLATDEILTFDLALYYRALERLELYALARNLLDSDFIVARRPYGARPNAPLSIQVGMKVDL